MAGRSVIPEGGADIDLLEEVAYWLDHEFSEIDNSEFSGMQCFKDDHIAMWYHPLDSQEITYLMGPVVKKFSYATCFFSRIVIARIYNNGHGVSC